MWCVEWHFEPQIFGIINDNPPQRYKVRLENRSYAEGASREAKTLEEKKHKLRTREPWPLPSRAFRASMGSQRWRSRNAGLFLS